MDASIDPDPTQKRFVSTAELEAPANFTAAAALLAAPGLQGPGWAEGPGFFAPWGFSAADRDFRRYMDAMRFRGEMHAVNERAAASASLAWDPDAPVRCGGETMLLSNQPHNGWWRQGLAKVAAEFGGFYDSMHLPWHYVLGNERLKSPEVANEYDVDITVQILARAIFSDLQYPNQWAGAFESTGGPAILSAGQGMTVDAAQIRRLMLTYTAVGLKGIGLWAWNSRWHGLEGGEYSLTDRQGMPSDRAIEAGKVAAALQSNRFELWDATERPLVGILRSYTNEAVWARLGSSMILPVSCAVSGCADRQRERPYRPTKSMLGYARVLSALSIPWRFVSEEQFGDSAFGAMNLSTIIIPAAVALKRSTLPLILKYVEAGGHVIADQPFVLFDEDGNTVNHARTTIPTIFGTIVQDYFDTSNGYEKTATLESGQSLSVHGIYGQIATDKKNANWTVESDGWVSRTSNRMKAGAATLFNYELGQKLFGETQRLRFDPGVSLATSELQNAILLSLGNRMPWVIESDTIAPVIIRRKVREMDFLFAMNRAASPCSAQLVVRQSAYKKIVDVLDPNTTIQFNNHRSNLSVSILLDFKPGEMIWLRAESAV